MEPKEGDFTPGGLAILQAMLAAWLYTTVSLSDQVKSAKNPNTIIGQICDDLAEVGLKADSNDVGSYVQAVRAKDSPIELANVLIHSNAVSQVTVYVDPGDGNLQSGAMTDWGGGGHPSPTDLLAAFRGTQS